MKGNVSGRQWQLHTFGFLAHQDDLRSATAPIAQLSAAYSRRARATIDNAELTVTDR
jgi:hypothetical protein